jgi:hypothetical protein
MGGPGLRAVIAEHLWGCSHVFMRDLYKKLQGG